MRTTTLERIKGHRWVQDDKDCWYYESKPRHYHGFVKQFSDGDWAWYFAFDQRGTRTTMREAVNCVVRCRRNQLAR